MQPLAQRTTVVAAVVSLCILLDTLQESNKIEKRTILMMSPYQKVPNSFLMSFKIENETDDSETKNVSTAKVYLQLFADCISVCLAPFF